MRSLYSTVLVAGFLSLLPARGACQAYPPDIPDARVEVFKTLDSGDLKLWIMAPTDHEPSQKVPAVVFFFGGAFLRGSPAQFLPQARALQSEGMVSILADYRVADRHGTGPSRAVEDAKSAIRWVRSHAEELGVDPTRIAAGGGSSGGQLAASSATLPGFEASSEDRSVSSRPDALILFNPALIIAPVEGLFEGTEGIGAPADAPLFDLSPYHHIGPDPVPTLIMHGREDELFPMATVRAYCDRAMAKGGLCEVEAYEGVGHGFFNRPPHRELTIQRATVFLESLAWLDPGERAP